MKKLILITFWLFAIGFLAGVASADTTISSATYAGVSISTSVPTRVDNITTGGGTGVINSRAEIKIQNYRTNTYSIFCGFDASVSTDTANARAGEEIVPGSSINVTLNALMTYYCQCDAAAAASQRGYISQGAGKQGN